VTSESLSALVAALLSAAIGLSVYLEDRRRPTFRAFTGLCMSLFAYHLTNFIGLLNQSVAAVLVSYLAALVIPLTLLRFTRGLLSDDPAESPPWDVWLLIVSLGFAGVLVYLALFPSEPALVWFKAGVFLYVIGSMGLSGLIIYRRYQAARSEVDRTRLRYIFIGLAITALTLVGAYLPWASGTVLPALGILFTTLYLYFLSQNLFLHRLLDLQEVLARVSILSVMVIIISAVYALLLAWVDPAEEGMFAFNIIIASVIVLILIDPLRSTIEERVNQYLFREKFELSQHLLELNREIRHQIEVDELADIVIRRLKQTRRVTAAALYVAAEDGSALNLRGHVGPQPPERLDTVTNASFLERLKGAGSLVLDTLVMEREAQRHGWETAAGADQAMGAVIRTMEELGAGVCIPLSADEQLLGLLAIDDERMREPYSTDELDLLKGVAGQIAISLQNSRIFQALRERDRLAVLGQMSAGLAHEIRNPLGAIKGAAQYLRPGRDGDEGAEDGAVPGVAPEDEDRGPEAELSAEVTEFLDIIIEEVDRLNRVVSQFLDYARPDHGQREQLQINDVVRRSVQMIEQEAPPEVTVRVQLDESLPPTRANPEQLHQVFLNLGKNALQAMPEGGVLTIATRALRRGQYPGTWIEASFRDTGAGIPPESLKSLFIPFFTTKGGGTGLGLPISQRIAENHGGTIRVHSTVGRGTTFTLSLPLTTAETTTAS